VNHFLPERRISPRLPATCDAEVHADIAILSGDVADGAEPLVFFGQAIDLSATGVALNLPSIQIDERYCNGANRLSVSLQLPAGVIELGVAPVRCVAFDDTDKGLGTLLGARIITITDQRKFDEYLQTLSRT
jgi:hypothetical protein